VKRSKKVTADAVEWYTQLALERDGKVTRHGPVEPPPPAAIDDSAEEKEFMAEVVKLATRNCWKHYHTHDSRKSVRGWPDLVLVRRYVIYAELKTNAGRTTPDQDSWLEALMAAGQDVRIWRPSDWPEIVATLEATP
jgi:hypothetical protein